MDNKKYVAGDGKVWRHKESGIIGGKELLFGAGDSIENWEEISEQDAAKIDQAELAAGQ